MKTNQSINSKIKNSANNSTRQSTAGKRPGNVSSSYNPNLNNHSTNKSGSVIKPFKNQNNPEDEYISNLQKQIYYLELEMKLMKDKEIETKNKVGGYEILFRDGVPLNEHFLALKTKYTNEKEHFEKLINDTTNEINNIENENTFITGEIDSSNKNYYGLAEKFSQDSDYYSNRIFELNSKLINENHTKESLLKDKDILGKQLYKFNSENVHFQRTLEKNKLFKENIEEKNLKTKEKHVEKFNEVDKQVTRSLLEYESLERKLSTNSKQQQIENENTELIYTLNRLEREFHMAKAKITESENIKSLNRKQLLDEELAKKIHEKTNSKLNEENLKQKVKENEKNQSIIIKNSISNNEIRMNNLLQKFKQEEASARELLEEKNSLAQKISIINEDIENQKNSEMEGKHEIIDLKDAIKEYEILLEENNATYENLTSENAKYKSANEKYESDIKVYNKKMEELLQKIELNSILKDVDINELKNLSQNNALVNNSINSLISKWDKVHLKLSEMEENSKK
jgi:hypothetical protein